MVQSTCPAEVLATSHVNESSEIYCPVKTSDDYNYVRDLKKEPRGSPIKTQSVKENDKLIVVLKHYVL